MTRAQDIAEILLQTGAVHISVDNPFTWTSGIRAPIYCDVRKLYGHPEERTRIVDALTDAIRHLPVMPDGIAGTATAAIGWAALVAERLALPFAYVRPMAKEHGTRKRVEGDLPCGQGVVVIEDLLSTAGSAVASVAVLREECAAEVTDVMAIFSYEFPVAFGNARRCGVRLHPLSLLTTCLEISEKMGVVTPNDVEEVRSFLRDPEGWGGKKTFAVALAERQPDAG